MNRADDSVYRKTAAGAAALATRSGALTPRARMALILVNGHDSLALLAGKLGADAMGLVQTLLDGGLVEEVVTVATPAPAPPPAPRAPADARLASLKHTAIVRLTPHFGPDVEVVCRPLLAAATNEAYAAALAAIESKLSVYLGRKGAGKLLVDLHPLGDTP